ncbi:MAG: homoserine kinase [Bacteroidetes bacterium]|nr:homoserine kinase [Bacteroidota bacterium]
MTAKNSCAFAPASIANLSCGFDSLGMALSSMGDKVEITISDKSQSEIIEQRNGGNISTDWHRNSVGVVIAAMQQALNHKAALSVRIEKGFQSGSGLGSSSASSAAAAFAYNTLMGCPFNSLELIPFAMKGEEAACGSAHADNVAAAILGGLVLVREHTPLDVIKLPVPNNLHAAILFPQIELNTSDSRIILPGQLPLQNATRQWANLGAFVASLYQNDFKLMKRAMNDYVAEPMRKRLIPYFDRMREVAMACGALSFGISGSGPAVFAFTHDRKTANEVLSNLQAVFQGTSVATLGNVEKIEEQGGARLIKSFNE